MGVQASSAVPSDQGVLVAGGPLGIRHIRGGREGGELTIIYISFVFLIVNYNSFY